jgi:hypothetical protein
MHLKSVETLRLSDLTLGFQNGHAFIGNGKRLNSSKMTIRFAEMVSFASTIFMSIRLRGRVDYTFRNFLTGGLVAPERLGHESN